VKKLGTILLLVGIVALITPRLNLHLPEGVTIPTLPTDIFGVLLIVAGIAKNVLTICIDHRPT
jgi:hypothetical protein